MGKAYPHVAQLTDEPEIFSPPKFIAYPLRETILDKHWGQTVSAVNHWIFPRYTKRSFFLATVASFSIWLIEVGGASCFHAG